MICFFLYTSGIKLFVERLTQFHDHYESGPRLFKILLLINLEYKMNTITNLSKMLNSWEHKWEKPD